MDYVKYYHDQANELSGFRGFAYQRGSGVGSILRKFFNYFAPAIKNTLIPTINKGLGFVKDEAISGLTNFTNDILSAKTRFDESISNITSKLQKGSGKTKVKRLQKSCIFD